MGKLVGVLLVAIFLVSPFSVAEGARIGHLLVSSIGVTDKVGLVFGATYRGDLSAKTFPVFFDLNFFLSFGVACLGFDLG